MCTFTLVASSTHDVWNDPSLSNVSIFVASLLLLAVGAFVPVWLRRRERRRLEHIRNLGEPDGGASLEEEPAPHP